MKEVNSPEDLLDLNLDEQMQFLLSLKDMKRKNGKLDRKELGRILKLTPRGITNVVREGLKVHHAEILCLHTGITERKWADHHEEEDVMSVDDIVEEEEVASEENVEDDDDNIFGNNNGGMTEEARKFFEAMKKPLSN